MEEENGRWPLTSTTFDGVACSCVDTDERDRIKVTEKNSFWHNFYCKSKEVKSIYLSTGYIKSFEISHSFHEPPFLTGHSASASNRRSTLYPPHCTGKCIGKHVWTKHSPKISVSHTIALNHNIKTLSHNIWQITLNFAHHTECPEGSPQTHWSPVTSPSTSPNLVEHSTTFTGPRGP